MSMLAFTTQAVPSRAQQSKKTTNAERNIREEYQLEVLGSGEMAESRNAEIRECSGSESQEIEATEYANACRYR